MAKVVVERPRHRRGHATLAKRAHKRFCARLADDAPAKEPICPYGDRKHFDDHLGPLRRYLSANVGRPWSKVYSEVCARIRPTSTVQRHILGHLFSFVERDVVVIERGIPYAHGYRALTPVESYRHHSRFYVHPTSGLLLPAPLAPRRKTWHELQREHDEAAHVPVRVVDGVVYARFGGLWFRPVLQPKLQVDRVVVDVIGRDVVRDQIATSKGKQLSSRELRALGLVNDPT